MFKSSDPVNPIFNRTHLLATYQRFSFLIAVLEQTVCHKSAHHLSRLPDTILRTRLSSYPREATIRYRATHHHSILDPTRLYPSIFVGMSQTTTALQSPYPFPALPPRRLLGNLKLDLQHLSNRADERFKKLSFTVNEVVLR